MTSFIVEYDFSSSWHPYCLCDKEPFPRKYEFKITPESLSKNHVIPVVFTTFAGGLRNYLIKMKLNGKDETIDSISDVASITLSYSYKKVTEFEETFRNSSITLPCNIWGDIKDFAKDKCGWFRWYVCQCNDDKQKDCEHINPSKPLKKRSRDFDYDID